MDIHDKQTFTVKKASNGDDCRKAPLLLIQGALLNDEYIQVRREYIHGLIVSLMTQVKILM